MKRIAVIVVIVVLVLAVAGLSVVLYTGNSALRTAYVQAGAAATQAVSYLTASAGDLATARVQATALAGEFGTAKADLATKQAELDAGAAANSCPGPKPSIDYTSNATVSEGLTAWVGDTTGSVEKPTWEVIWSNSRTAIHKLPSTSKYLKVFVVTFDEPDLDKVHSIYDVGQHCYLDR